MLANFIFLSEDEKNGKVKLYFELQDGGDVVEVSWANADYIASKLAAFGVKNVTELGEALNDPNNNQVEVYKYEYTNKEGQKQEGYTLDEPFPKATEPTKSIVSGKVVDVRNNGLKVAVTVDIGKGEQFTVVRSYYVFDQAQKKSYPLEAKRQNLLTAFGVKDFGDLTGSKVTFIRQSAGSNYYYEPSEG